MIPDFLSEFHKAQLEEWPLARQNYESLKEVKKKKIRIGDIDGFVHFNPHRAGSTLAKTDKSSILNRPCFLCKENRTREQKSIEIIPDHELLVNPYPILPYHFTIAGLKHETQKLEISVALSLAENLPGMLVFYNGTGAGASAPDHKHFQCVPIEELPLIKKISYHLKRGVNIALPYRILTDSKKIQEIQTQVSLNAYFWKSEDDEILCFAIPRRAHRPKSFFMDPPMRRAVSPGALDMAGIIVTPMEEDFKLLQEEEIEEILREVGFPNE